MSKGFVDMASMSDVISFLSYEKLESIPSWTMQCASQVTAALCCGHQLQVAPGPGDFSGRVGLYDRLITNLTAGDAVLNYPFSEALRREADKETLSWANKHTPLIIKEYYKVKSDKSYDFWLDKAISIHWVLHSTMLYGLFNKHYVPLLAKIFGCNRTDLMRVWQDSCAADKVKQWVKKRPNSEDFKLAIDAYVVSVLLRGRYHDHCVELSTEYSILHHPVRHNRVLPLRKETNILYPTNTEALLTSIVLGSTMVEKTIENRINLWCENILKIRELVRTEKLDLRQKQSNSVALDHLHSSLRKHIRMYRRSASTKVDFLFSVIMSSLVFGLCKWQNLPTPLGWLTGPSITLGTKRLTGRSIGEIIISRSVGRKLHFKQLAETLPCRIMGKWIK